jgi:hypothetical protein
MSLETSPSSVAPRRQPPFRPAELFLVLLGIGLIHCAMPASVQAQSSMSVKAYQEQVQGLLKNRDNKAQPLQFYVRGFVDAMEATNAAYVKAGAKPFICMPQNPRPRLFDVLMAIEVGLKLDQPGWMDNPLEPVEPFILLALIRTWPCK